VSDEQTDKLIDRRIADAVALIGARLDGDDRARVLQAGEYERRLEILNGEHSTLSSMRETYVLREVYAKDLERLYTERNETRKAAEEQRLLSDAAKVAAQRNAMVAAMGMVIALVGWGITLVFHYLPATSS
jgi:hypothetical protein